MQYTLLSDNFGGLNTYMADDKVGPGGAVLSQNVDISTGSLRNRFDDLLPTLDGSGVWVGTETYVPATSKTIVHWKTGCLGMEGRYAVARYAGRLYRSHRGFGAFPSSLYGIQYTSDTADNPRWDLLGMFQPGDPALSVAATGSGSTHAAGKYTYWCTFYNSLGQESSAASATVTLSSAGNITVTLPKGYTTCTTSTTSTTITSIGDVGRIKPGMRITGSGIPTDTYVVSVNTSASSAVLSKTPTSAASGVRIVDAQVVGTRVYRQSDFVKIPLLVQQTANLTTTSFVDSTADSALGAQATTVGLADNPDYLRDVCISPSGVLFCVGPNDTMIYMDLTGAAVYDPGKTFKVADVPMASIYALNRFVFPTQRGAFTVSLEDPVAGLPVIQVIDNDESCKGSEYCYATDLGSEVWWNTSKGICSTNGDTIETVTKYVFERSTAEAFVNAFGAIYHNGEYLIYAQKSAGNVAGASIFSYTRKDGWTELVPYMKNQTGSSDAGTIGYNGVYDSVIYNAKYSDSTAAVRRLRALTSRVTGGAYWTGAWTGEKSSSLKKFRKVSALFKGEISIQPYIDDTVVGSALTRTNATMTRFSWWLPSEAKGRKVSFIITLTGSNVELEEIGVWIGEEREPMP